MKRMRNGSILVGAAATLFLLGGGCATAPKAGDASVNYDVPKLDPAKSHQTSGAQPADFSEMPTPPADAQYTIYCQAYAGADHQEVARHIRDLLRANTSMRKWYVVHGDQQSTLYYGFYRTIDRRSKTDAGEGERALADLEALRTLHDSRGVRLFSASLPVSINSPDPAANPAWDITRSGGYWSMEVATFKDTADRKVRAVEAVTDARHQGYDAYYYHGPRASSVCIGSWPRAAAVEITTAMENPDPSKPLLVMPSQPSDAYRASLDKNIQTAAPHVEPVDPSLIQALAAWPAHAVNGFTQMKADAAGGATDVPLERPFLFVIPNAGDGVAGGDTVPMADAAVPVTPDATAAVAPPAAPGTGQLRSLEDPH